MKYLILTLAFFCLFTSTHCQSDLQYGDSARSISLGNVGAGISGIESIGFNPAGIVETTNLSMFASAETRFSISELTSMTVGLAKSVQKWGAVGLHFTHLGIEEYRIQKFAATYARYFGPRLSIGVEFDYFRRQIVRYGSDTRLGIAAGLRYNLSDNLTLGMSSYALIDTEITDQKYLSRIGLGYMAGEKVQLFTDLTFSNSSYQALHFGAEYSVTEALVTRLGIQTRPALFSVGIGYLFSNKWRIDGGMSSHQYLGRTPSASLIFEN